MSDIRVKYYYAANDNIVDKVIIHLNTDKAVTRAMSFFSLENIKVNDAVIVYEDQYEDFKRSNSDLGVDIQNVTTDQLLTTHNLTVNSVVTIDNSGSGGNTGGGDDNPPQQGIIIIPDSTFTYQKYFDLSQESGNKIGIEGTFTVNNLLGNKVYFDHILYDKDARKVTPTAIYGALNSKIGYKWTFTDTSVYFGNTRKLVTTELTIIVNQDVSNAQIFWGDDDVFHNNTLFEFALVLTADISGLSTDDKNRSGQVYYTENTELTFYDVLNRDIYETLTINFEEGQQWDDFWYSYPLCLTTAYYDSREYFNMLIPDILGLRMEDGNLFTDYSILQNYTIGYLDDPSDDRYFNMMPGQWPSGRAQIMFVNGEEDNVTRIYICEEIFHQMLMIANQFRGNYAVQLTMKYLLPENMMNSLGVIEQYFETEPMPGEILYNILFDVLNNMQNGIYNVAEFIIEQPFQLLPNSDMDINGVGWIYMGKSTNTTSPKNIYEWGSGIGGYSTWYNFSTSGEPVVTITKTINDNTTTNNASGLSVFVEDRLNVDNLGIMIFIPREEVRKANQKFISKQYTGPYPIAVHPIVYGHKYIGYNARPAETTFSMEDWITIQQTGNSSVHTVY